MPIPKKTGELRERMHKFLAGVEFDDIATKDPYLIENLTDAAMRAHAEYADPIAIRLLKLADEIAEADLPGWPNELRFIADALRAERITELEECDHILDGLHGWGVDRIKELKNKLTAAEARIAELEAAQAWHAPELAPESVWRLCLIEDGVHMEGRRCRSHPKWTTYWTSRDGRMIHPIAQRPLPEPPSELITRA